ncbi:MAG: DUF3445 domain-containing protein [Verrucomicrobiae bacterium]|nr:DUF3445 domain-containing protein [Verrucomicrobiae bacterium]
MREPDWLRLFPEDDFRWAMNLRSGDSRDFFSPSGESAEALELRRHLLETAPENYVLLPDDQGDTVRDAVGHLSRWSGLPLESALEAGRCLEPDWVLLAPGGDGEHRVVAGVVCFPSGWALPEKAGLPMMAVHGPVPRLNDALGRQVGSFLSRLVPGVAWERENWGLSADSELDHHPRHPRIRLTGREPADAVWVRLERQLLVRLPGGAVFFGIRVSNHRLDRLVAATQGLAERVARVLRTMPEEAARYKGIAEARIPLSELLDPENRSS